MSQSHWNLSRVICDRASARARGLFVGGLIALLAVVGLSGAPRASASSWETVDNFAPLTPPPPNPPSWPEDVQLGGVTGMAVNRTGAGGVAPGTIYTVGVSAGEWHAARYKPDGEFELAWTRSLRCGPKAAEPAHPTCQPYPTGAAGRVDIAINQTTGNVYVFYLNELPTVLREYDANGIGPIAEFGQREASGTVASSPDKIHGSPVGENIAVDDSGFVYVSDEDTATDFYHRLMVFRPQTPGDYEHYVYAGQSSDVGGGFSGNPPYRPLLDDAGDVYVGGEGYIEKYDPAKPATPICTFALTGGGITSITVNPETGAPFFYSFKDRKVHQLSPCNGEGKFVEKDSGGAFVEGPPFSAVPQRGNIEALTFDPARQFSPERSAGVLYGGAPEACPPVGSCPPDAIGQSALGYMFGPQVSLKPTVVSEYVSHVGATSATLNAQVNPKGAQTTYVFQYLTADAYDENDPSERFAGASETPLGGAVLGNGSQPLLASVTIAGLSHATAYRYRVIATNTEGSTAGPGEGFQTFSIGVGGLPDDRAYELVSPQQKNGGEVLPGAPNVASCGNECKPGLAAKRFPVQVSPGGGAIAYQGSPFVLNEGASEFDEYISTRTTSGWQTRSISPPLAGDSGGAGFELFGLNTTLSSGIVFSRNEALVPEAPAGYLNLFREETANRFALTPALTNATTLHRVAGEGSGSFKRTYVGASTNFSRQFFEANDALTEAAAFAPPAVDGGAAKTNLYEWSDGQLHLVNVQPGNTETIPGAMFGSGFRLSTGQPPAADYSHAISSDGFRFFWSSEDGQVYVRESAELTKAIPDSGDFLSAAADGSRVLLSNGHVYDLDDEFTIDLTEGKGVFQGIVGQGEDLSHIYFVLGPSKGTGDLTIGSTTISGVKGTAGFFSVGQAIEGAGIPAGTTIVSVGAGTLQLSNPATATGSDLPLVAQSPLTGEIENSEGAVAQTGQNNLYSWDEGSVAFVGTLGAGDNSEYGVWHASPVRRSGEASPNGRWLTFMSKTPLTGFGNVGACDFDPSVGKYVGSVPCEEVFLYDSQSGSLICASCNPGGAHPLGGSFLRLMMNATGSLSQPRYLTDNGRLYFDSRDALSGLDTNNQVEDVYQYEPNGVGSCAQAGGCISLITSGRGSYDSNFLATDPSGDNVFFTTRQQLVPRDQDQLIDLYDARVGGGIADESVAPPRPCVGESCPLPAAPPPSEPSPASSSFEGPGNATGKKPAKKKKKHHKSKKHKNKGKQSKNQRGGSK